MKIERCFHCGWQNKIETILFKLQPSPDAAKLVCLNCLYTRHYPIFLEIIEKLLDKE